MQMNLPIEAGKLSARFEAFSQVADGDSDEARRVAAAMAVATIDLMLADERTEVGGSLSGVGRLLRETVQPPLNRAAEGHGTQVALSVIRGAITSLTEMIDAR